jgi:hypothetical protein
VALGSSALLAEASETSSRPASPLLPAPLPASGATTGACGLGNDDRRRTASSAGSLSSLVAAELRPFSPRRLPELPRPQEALIIPLPPCGGLECLRGERNCISSLLQRQFAFPFASSVGSFSKGAQ